VKLPNKLQPTETYVDNATKMEVGDEGGPVFEAHRRLLRRLVNEEFTDGGQISRHEDVDEDRYLKLLAVVVPSPAGEPTRIELRGLRLRQKGVLHL
jgi:hypothetical protein